MTVRHRAFVLPVVGLFLASLLATPAFAATSSTSSAKAQQTQIGKKLSQLRDQEKEASADEAELLGRLDDINNRKADVEARVAALEAEIASVQAAMEAAQARILELEEKLVQADAALEAARIELATSTKKMEDQAVDAYVGQEADLPLASFIFRAEDLRELSAASEYLAQVVSERRKVVERHRELEGQARDLTVEIEASKVEAAAARDAIAAQQAQLVVQKQDLVGLQAQVVAEAEAQNALLAEVEAKKATILAQMATLQRESESIAAMLRGVGAGGRVLNPGRGVLAIPVPGAPMTSPFGPRVHPIFGTVISHAGQDFAAGTGTPIHAAADGTVVTAGVVSGYGNYTCIAHSGGLASCYGHQSRIMVTAGQRVSRNSIIGLVGSTGNSTGPHLHFEVRLHGTPVNPVAYF